MTEKTETNRPPLDALVMYLKPGMPEEDGWYFVKLIPGHNEGTKKYDVDYCRARSPSDGGGREWCKWYPHNISYYAELDT